MFKFKGISSKDMKIIVEEEEHFIAKAPQRIDVIEIEGRDGAIFNELGYSVIERPIKVQFLTGANIDKVLAWLNGEGILEYKNKITKARFYSLIEPIRTTIIKVASFNFIRDPFWYKNEYDDTFLTVTDTVTNEGNIEARPIIRLEKGEDERVDLTIGGVRFTYNFPKTETYVEIDCEEMTATYENLLRNRQLLIGYEFPLLPVGKSKVTVNSGDATIKVKRKDRWL